jgi:hypothetical protein
MSFDEHLRVHHVPFITCRKSHYLFKEESDTIVNKFASLDTCRYSHIGSIEAADLVATENHA